MKEFYEDKKREESSIKDAIRLMEKDGFNYVKSNNDIKYDLEFNKDGKSYFVEVKQDFSCFRTGNIGVEYSCRGKISGILASKSDFYIYKIHQNIQYTKQVLNVEKEKPKDISIILINKNKLKSCITQIIEHIKIEEEERNYDLKQLLVSPKPNFYKRTIIDDETKKTYIVTVRNINGGDIGSNSLNILFDRQSFIENFTLKYLETRYRTEKESIDLKETLDNANNRNKKRYY